MRGPIVLICSLCMILAGSPRSFGGQTDIPFQPGEKLTFKVYWSFIPAGEAILEILPPENRDGTNCFHFRATAKTFEYIDVIYKVRDTLDAYADTSMTRSIAYTKLQKGKSKRDVAVDFDWEKGEARYSDAGEKRSPVKIQPGTFDPLSVFYAFRLHELEEGREFVRPVTDGKRTVLGRAKVIGREKIQSGGREFDTFLVEPEIENIGGIFEKRGNSKLQIWVTADRRRIPVRIKSAVRVGSFVAELESLN